MAKKVFGSIGEWIVDFAVGKGVKLRASILMDSNEQELFTPTNPGSILPGEGNVDITLLPQAIRTVEANSGDQLNSSGRGLILFVRVYSITNTPSVTPRLQIRDSISGVYFTIWTAAAAVTAAGSYAYLFDLGGVGFGGNYTEAVNLRLGRVWRLIVQHANTDGIEYSVSATLLV